MAPKFGTSGLRGLVTDLTPDLVAAHVRAFLAACAHGGTLHVGRDLRPSSPEIAEVVLETARAAGLDTVDTGAVPTPALALSAMSRGHAAVMVTGSHIPADRNGLKFYVPRGEISKDDEARILEALGHPGSKVTAPGHAHADPEVGTSFVARYVTAYGRTALQGLRVGVYQHSSVARDLLTDVVTRLGGVPVALARSDSFVPVDTEALDPGTRQQLAGWARDHRLDAIVSTDGDADRPMVADADGRVVPGDVLGPLTARALRARIVCTPVSSNSLVDEMSEFSQVVRTRIGSPYVIAAMEHCLADDPGARVVGYEANGGFLLGFAARGAKGALQPLMTRDCLLPIVGSLAAARAADRTLAQLVLDLPQRFTFADRIAGIPSASAQAFIAALASDPAARRGFFDTGEEETGLDQTDGLRARFAGGEIVHLRPSGNAPEFRCYAEATTAARAEDLVMRHLARIRDSL